MACAPEKFVQLIVLCRFSEQELTTFVRRLCDGDLANCHFTAANHRL